MSIVVVPEHVESLMRERASLLMQGARRIAHGDQLDVMKGIEMRVHRLLIETWCEGVQYEMAREVDWPTLLRDRARKLRERANSVPNTVGATHALKIAEELGRLCNVHAPKAKHVAGDAGRNEGDDR